MALADKAALEAHRSKMTDDELNAFVAKFGMHPVELPVATQLYKYSGDYPFKERENLWSPWWNARAGTRHVLEGGRSVSWTGLAPRLTAAMKGEFSDVREARIRSAVKHEWNAMRNLCLAELRVTAWAWFGQCKGQRVSDADPQYRNVFLPGGDYQYYIPDLKRVELKITAAHCGLDEGRL